MEYFLTSDQHFNHERCLFMMPERQKKWNNLQEMNEGLIKNWNSVVSKNDTVIHVGDFCFYDVEIISQLNGNIELHLGNHDHKSQVNKLLSKKYIHHACNYSGRRFLGKNFHIQHWPCDNWPGKEDGTILLHGHTHGTRKAHFNELDVGVDTKYANYTPMEISQVHRTIMQRNKNF